jgi:choline dehydrogenase-like flavoprotein
MTKGRYPIVTTLDKNYDVIVVGSGATGSIAVKELTERGLDVLLLEAGRDISEADFTPPDGKPASPFGMGLGPRINAAVHGQYMQARRAIFSPQVNAFLVNDRENPYTTPRGDRFLWIRGRLLGGRLHSYGRVLMRMSDYDFKAASIDGNGSDWPFSYSELAPYYDRVEEFTGIYGEQDGVPAIPDGKVSHPPKFTAAEKDFKERVESAWPDRRVISWRYAAPNPHRVPLGILAARKTGRLTTRTDAIVRKVTVNKKTGKADGAVFIDRLTKAEHRVWADVVLLCASTIESVRILLNSACEGHQDGLGNSSGLLGRYFMDQCPSLTVASIPHIRGYEVDDAAPPDPFYAPAGGVFIPRFLNLNGRTTPGFARGFSFQGSFGRIPVPEGLPAACGMMGFGEMLPYYDNRITVDLRRADAWGIPVPRIRCAMTGNERALLREQTRVIREIFDGNGYRLAFSGSQLGLDSRHVWPDSDPLSRLIFRLAFPRSLAIGASIHECGGARMGDDPNKSVLNGFNQSWDVPNLFVTDASCFVSGGSVGPTLTIMALTARTCEYIAGQHAEGAL